MRMAMLAELKVRKLLAGYRGAPPADIDALVRAICGLSDLFLSHRHLLRDIEINPLVVLPAGRGARARRTCGSARQSGTAPPKQHTRNPRSDVDPSVEGEQE